jgi:hypothetical protein
MLTPGLNLLDNRTGRPELLAPVETLDYDRLGRAVASALAREIQGLSIEVDNHKFSKVVSRSLYERRMAYS